ncbi:MAG: DUF2807 domain-containing protein [Alistipes sp.]|nr:DUF2807 domain-containing protein [Alistipes sp.]
MKRILALISAVALLGICTASAQYKKTVLPARQIAEFNTNLPVDLTLVDAADQRAIVEIPSDVADWIKCEIDGNEISIYPKRGAGNKIKSLSSDNPIKVRIESSSIKCINNTGIIRMTCKNRRLNRFELNNSGIITWKDVQVEFGYLEINNSGVCNLEANRITADDIEINNSGRFLCAVNIFCCDCWEHNNSGVNDIKSAVKANSVECNSSGREDLRLNVTCKELEVNATGIGSMTFSGTADDIDISSTGLTRISTSAVNTK